MRTAVIAMVLVVASAGTASVGVAQEGPTEPGGLSLGERLSAVVSAQQVETRNRLGDRTFEVRFERGPREAVEERIRSMEERIRKAEERRRSLEDNRSLSPGMRAVRLSELDAEFTSINRSAEKVLEKSRRVEDIDMERVRSLRRNTSRMDSSASGMARGMSGREGTEKGRDRNGGIGGAGTGTDLEKGQGRGGGQIGKKVGGAR